MAERFFKRYTLPPKQYLENCPIIIEAGSLLQDTKTGAVLAQIKFRNIGEDTVTACRVCIHAFGPDGKEIEGLEEYWYMDLNAACDQDFGSKVPVILPKASTSRFSVAITEVVLSSGKVWEHASAQWQQIPKQESVNQVLPSAELCAQYYLEMGTNHSEYYPVCYDRFFLCTCGAVNDASADTCHTCNRKRIAVLQMAERQGLVHRAADRLAKEEEERLAREQAEAERKEQERIVAEQRAEEKEKIVIKVRKMAPFIIAVILIVGVGFWFSVSHYLPSKKYEQAVALYNAGEYEQAKALFISLNGFGSSSEWLPICEEAILKQDYWKAVKLLEEGNFAEAKAMFTQLSSYGDSKERLNECEIGITYQNAQNLLSTGKFKEAVDIFIELGSYQDSENLKLAAYYGLGTQKMANHEWEAAINAFNNVDEYKDASAKIMESRYQLALSLLAAKDYSDAYQLLSQIKGYKDVASIIINNKKLFYTVGFYISFGTYPQEIQGKDQTPIEWLILAREGNKALLISRYALDVRAYNEEYGNITYEKSTVRHWLNNYFIDKAFSAAEKTAILTTHVTADKNPKWHTNPGNVTEDKIFLLSIQEANQYFENDVDRMCVPTNYAIKNGAYSGPKKPGHPCSWWLRSPGVDNWYAANVYDYGEISYMGSNAPSSFNCVRPAMWVDIESGVF